jgi:hypothetical protein
VRVLVQVVRPDHAHVPFPRPASSVRHMSLLIHRGRREHTGFW